MRLRHQRLVTTLVLVAALMGSPMSAMVRPPASHHACCAIGHACDQAPVVSCCDIGQRHDGDAPALPRLDASRTVGERSLVAIVGVLPGAPWPAPPHRIALLHGPPLPGGPPAPLPLLYSSLRN